MRRVVFASVAVLLLLGWQANGLALQSGQTGSPAGQSGAASGGPGGAAGKAEAQDKKAPNPDHAFVMEAASGGMMEVEAGRMAANQASSDEVKKFGQRMVDDHGKANNDLMALAQKKNITLPSQMTKKHQAARDHLAKLNGAAFDKAYMQHMVADHAKDVQAFQGAAKTAKDPDIKAWAAQVLPTLQEHLKLAKQIATTVGAMK